MIEGIYQFLNNLFGPIMLNVHPLWVITFMGFLIGGLYTVIYYLLTDVEQMKRIQRLSKEVQKEMREARESGDEKKLRRAQRKQMELMKMQGELMKQQMVPMILTMPIFWIIFSWLRAWYVEVAIVKAPFQFFLFDLFHRLQHSALPPDQLGYIGWYVLSSYAIGMVLRKLLDMG